MPDIEMPSVEIPAFIDDGYEQDGYIAAVERMYPAIAFKFRPMTPADVEKFVKAAAREGAVMADAQAAFLEKHLTYWSLERPRKLAIIARLRPPVLKKLFAIVSGGVPSDLPPKPTEEQEANEDKSAREIDEDDAKN